MTTDNGNKGLEYEIDVTKVISPVPDTIFDSIRQCSKLEQVIFDALFIMQSAIQFKDDPELRESVDERMMKFLSKFCTTH